MSEFEIVKSEYNALDEQGNYKTHFFKTSADQVVGLGRLKSFSYAVDDVVYTDNNNKVALKCITAGTTSNTELDISTKNIGDTVTDGTVVWQVCNRTSDVTSVNGKTGDVVVGEIVDASISGKVITLTFADGTTKDLTTQDTVKYFLPNFSAGIVNQLTYNAALTYIAPADGWIVWDIYAYNGEMYLTINGVDISRRTQGGAYMTTATGAIMVKKDDVIVARAYYNTTTSYYHYGSQTVKFFPFA